MELGMHNYWNGNIKTSMESVWRGEILDTSELAFTCITLFGEYEWLKLFLFWIEQVAAIFKIGNSKDMPEIPEHLSNDAKNFIKLCLQRDPLARPTAHKLLDHPFIRDQSATKAANVSITRDAFPCMFDGSRTPVYILRYIFIFFEKSCSYLLVPNMLQLSWSLDDSRSYKVLDNIQWWCTHWISIDFAIIYMPNHLTFSPFLSVCSLC